MAKPADSRTERASPKRRRDARERGEAAKALQIHKSLTVKTDLGTEEKTRLFCQIAEDYKARLDASGAFDNPIVTEIAAASTYYPAEDYHQNYFAENPDAGYCRAVIAPKMEKFRRVFAGDLK